ncbi:Exo_endo_phos domain-containing protein [Gossypium australe]|uniref:Exo_endo_phos domain-containing protein n=1 Tax=Gossypium australe TaxID=47621 RepID=A0A5B6UU56_9ROSI|nr:Exo_endo_phos domain-containing protein [Gossypium australe]
MERIRKKFRFQNGIEVSTNGTRGGLCLGWKNEMDIRLMGYNENCIDVMVNNDGNRPEWRLTGFYGAPDVRDRADFWNLLRNLSHNSSKAWVVLGDFNEIISNQEKCGGRYREEKQMDAFQEALDYCVLTDLDAGTLGKGGILRQPTFKKDWIEEW